MSPYSSTRSKHSSYAFPTSYISYILSVARTPSTVVEPVRLSHDTHLMRLWLSAESQKHATADVHIASTRPPLPFEPTGVEPGSRSSKNFKAFKFNSVGSQFKRQLSELMTQLHTMEPHYIRCIKPNSLNKPSIFENRNALHQLRCGGESYPLEYGGLFKHLKYM